MTDHAQVEGADGGQAGPGEAQHAEYDDISYNVGLSGHHSSQLEVRGVPMPPPYTEVQRR